MPPSAKNDAVGLATDLKIAGAVLSALGLLMVASVFSGGNASSTEATPAAAAGQVTAPTSFDVAAAAESNAAATTSTSTPSGSDAAGTTGLAAGADVAADAAEVLGMSTRSEVNAASAASVTASPMGDTYEVVEVVDGDTIKVRRAGELSTVRMIDLDTPETVHPSQPVECWSQAVAASATELA